MKILIILTVVVHTTIFGGGGQMSVMTTKSEPMPAAACAELAERTKQIPEAQTAYCEDAK